MLIFKESPGALVPVIDNASGYSSLSLVTGPAVEPVTRDQFKLHARITRDDEDSLIDSLLKAARRYIEARQRRAIVTQTWRLTLDTFPAWGLVIPLPPLQSVSSITYVDNDGTTQTLDPSAYSVDTRSEPGRVEPAWGQYWPSARFQNNAVTVQFVAGYGLADSAPDTTKTAIKLLAAHWYENREATIAGTIIAPLPFAVEALLAAEEFGGYR